MEIESFLKKHRGKLTGCSTRPVGSTQEDWSYLSLSWQRQISFHKTCHYIPWCLAVEGPFLWCSVVGTLRLMQARTCVFHSRMSCIYTDGHPTARIRVRISYKLIQYMPTFSSANSVRYPKNSANWWSLTRRSRQLGAGSGSGFGHDPGSNFGAILNSLSAQGLYVQFLLWGDWYTVAVSECWLLFLAEWDDHERPDECWKAKYITLGVMTLSSCAHTDMAWSNPAWRGMMWQQTFWKGSWKRKRLMKVWREKVKYDAHYLSSSS